jgi:hypothetical protein
MGSAILMCKKGRSMSEVEREIVEFVLTLGVLSELGEHVADLALRGESLTVGETAIFQPEIARIWFRVECDQCCRPLPLPDIPAVIKTGEHLCRSCCGVAHADVPIVVSQK